MSLAIKSPYVHYGNYGFGFGKMSKKLKGRCKTRRNTNDPGVKMSNGKKISK